MHSYLTKFTQLSYEMPAIRVSLALIYLLFFFFTLEMMSKRHATRNLFTASLSLVFLALSLIFLSPFLFDKAAQVFTLPWVGMVMAILPAILFLYFRSQFSGAEESIASMERFNQLKDEFLSVASHELRTPLSVINGFAEILVREKLGPLNDEQKRRVRKILMQAQRLNHIVDELLDLSRIRSGKVQMRQDVFDLVPVLKACLDDQQVICEQQNIRLVDEIPDVLPDVSGDLDRINQILVNLLNNAIKYTDSGGVVTLAVEHHRAKNEIYIEVRDTGIGVEAKDQDRVFEEFFRSNNPAARRLSGSGLGLAIVKQLVESHGGTVGMKSEGLGKGSAFFFTLRPALKLGKEEPSRTRTVPLVSRKAQLSPLKKSA